MRKLLFALLSFMLCSLLLGSCGKNSYEDSTVLILADSLMQTYPDSALQLLEEISAPGNGESQPGMVCIVVDAGEI